VGSPPCGFKSHRPHQFLEIREAVGGILRGVSATSRPAASSLSAREWVGLLLIALISLFLIRRTPGELSVQSSRNLMFAHRASLEHSLEVYGRLRPPLYPCLLWVAQRAGFGPFAVTSLLHAATLIGLAVLALRAVPQVSPLVPAGAYALGHYCAVNLHQFTAEEVVAAGLPAMALLLWRHRTTGAAGPLMAAAAIGAVLGLSRLFAALVAPAAVALAALLATARPWRRRLALATASVLLAALPVGAWLAATYMKTGYLTGTDRIAPRVLPAQIAHWRELTGLDDHLVLTGRTLLVDFISPDRYAAQVVVTHPLRFSPFEAVALALLACALIGAAIDLVRSRAGPAPPVEATSFLGSPTSVTGGLFLLYVALTIAVWTFANNDPIYTRFLFPVYGLACVAAFGVDAALVRCGSSRWGRLPRLALLAVYVVAQVSRHLFAAPLPPRFEG
jgi:hypothetical protein